VRQAWIPPFASVPIEVAAVITRGVYSGEPEQSDTSFAQLLIVHDPVHAAQGLPTSSSSVLDIMSTAQRCNRIGETAGENDRAPRLGGGGGGGGLFPSENKESALIDATPATLWTAGARYGGSPTPPWPRISASRSHDRHRGGFKPPVGGA